MALFVALRLFFVRDGFSLAWFFHSCCGDEEMYSRLLAAAQSSLTCLEELLWKSGPIISFLFPAYGPLVSALIFACSNLTPQILSFARPVLSDSFGQAGGFEPDTAETTIEQGVADAVAFGCHFVANPDLPQRIRDMPALVAHFVEFLDWRVGRRNGRPPIAGGICAAVAVAADRESSPLPEICSQHCYTARLRHHDILTASLLSRRTGLFLAIRLKEEPRNGGLALARFVTLCRTSDITPNVGSASAQ
jgi:hypothetical protein